MSDVRVLHFATSDKNWPETETACGLTLDHRHTTHQYGRYTCPECLEAMREYSHEAFLRRMTR